MIRQWGQKNNLNSNRKNFFLTHVLSKNSLYFDLFLQKTRHNVLWHFTPLVNAS